MTTDKGTNDTLNRRLPINSGKLISIFRCTEKLLFLAGNTNSKRLGFNDLDLWANILRVLVGTVPGRKK